MDGNQIITLVGVVSAGLVGIIGALTPAWTRRKDREHETQAWIRDKRANAYRIALLTMSDPSPDRDRGDDPTPKDEARAEVRMWGSDEVLALFDQWADADAGRYTKGANDWTSESRSFQMKVQAAISADLGRQRS